MKIYGTTRLIMTLSDYNKKDAVFLSFNERKAFKGFMIATRF